MKLQKAGVNYKARCPFHNEKSGSFVVSPERQIWHCFGCGAGGDIFGFIKQIEGVEFVESLRMLAAKAGIELSKTTGDYPQASVEKDKLYTISELAAKFYEKQLWQSTLGKKVLTYLTNRGMTEDSVKNFRLGYAPDANSVLKEFLDRSGYNKKDMVLAGVVGKSENERYYDRFRNRIMFPVLDLNGRVVGFSGRIFDSTRGLSQTTTRTVADKSDVSVSQREVSDGQRAIAKYINTPQTAIYDKSRLLYGLHAAKLDLRRKDKCLVVEGNMDVIMSHQAGATNTVACSGTALTDGHLRIIKRYTENLDLCFDADSAGQSARDRGVELALAHGFNVGVVTIEEDGIKDAADYVQKHGNDWAEYTLKTTRPFMDFYMHNISKVYDTATAQGKKLISAKLLPLIKILPNKIEQNHWLRELSLLIKVNEDILTTELANTVAKIDLFVDQPKSPMSVQTNPIVLAINALDPLESSLISIAIKEPGVIRDTNLDLVSGTVSPPTLAILSAIREAPSNQFNDIIKLIDPAMVLPMEFANLKAQELWKDFSKEDLATELVRTVDQIKRRRVISKLTSLEFSIKEAEKNQDEDALGSLVAQFNELIFQNNKYLSENKDH